MSYVPPSGDGDQDVSNYASWDEQQLAAFFKRKGLGAYEEVLIKHKITGRLAPLLQDDDLKEIGVGLVGDRLLFKLCIKELQRKARFHKRVEALWQGKERMFFSKSEWAFMTCGGFFPVDPSTYKLQTNHLKVRQVLPVRCGPIPLSCFGVTYTSNNIDLSKVEDVDVRGIPAPCLQRVLCCAKGIDRIEVESQVEGKVFLLLEEGEGDHVANMILNQVEESQRMERS